MAPYHIGPHTPYEYAKVELVSSVALQVQAVWSKGQRHSSPAVRTSSQETIPDAMSPGLTDLDAVLNSSACFVEKPVCQTFSERARQRFA